MIYPKKMCMLPVVLMTFLTVGCGGAGVVPPTAFTVNDLSNASYNFVGLDDKETVVLLGQLNFAEVEESNISGTWSLETWGEQPHFSYLPADGTFSGFIHGQTAIITIDFPQTSESLGLVVEGFRESKLVGTLRLLPKSEFSGRFEAIRK